MNILIERVSSEKNQTIGNFYLLDKRGSMIDSWFSLELPWKNNEKYVSCIPCNEYIAYKHDSPKFGATLWIQDVPNRSEILIHPANFYSDLLGCVGIGKDLKWINRDSDVDVSASRFSMKEMLDMIKEDSIEVKIVNI